MTIKCDKCNGDGFILDENGEAHDCDKCYCCGYLDVETNEEWLRQASTEELAEFLADTINEIIDGITYEMEEGVFDQDDFYQTKHCWVEWLQEVHDAM